MAKNITIAIDEELARAARVEAAKAGMSVSRFVAEMLREKVTLGPEKRTRQLAAIERFLSGPDLRLMDGSGRPLRDQIYDDDADLPGYKHHRLQPRSRKRGKAD
jgi:plasmid stability protein